MGRIVTENSMEIDDELPEIDITVKHSEENSSDNLSATAAHEEDSKESVNKKQEELLWTAFDCCWQDFAPAVFSSIFLIAPSELPSLLSLVSDVSGKASIILTLFFYVATCAIFNY